MSMANLEILGPIQATRAPSLHRVSHPRADSTRMDFYLVIWHHFENLVPLSLRLISRMFDQRL